MKKFLLLLVLSSFYTAFIHAEDDTVALYNSTCRACHNSNGDGKTAAAQKMSIPDLRSVRIQKMSDDELFQTIGNGIEHKQYPHTFLRKGMTEAQVRQLVSYLRTLKK